MIYNSYRDYWKDRKGLLKVKQSEKRSWETYPHNVQTLWASFLPNNAKNKDIRIAESPFIRRSWTLEDEEKEICRKKRFKKGLSLEIYWLLCLTGLSSFDLCHSRWAHLDLMVILSVTCVCYILKLDPENLFILFNSLSLRTVRNSF